MRKLLMHVLVSLVFANSWSAAAGWCAGASHNEDDPATFYKGKTVRIVVGFPLAADTILLPLLAGTLVNISLEIQQ